MKKLLFLTCTLSIFGPLKAMDITPEMIAASQKEKISQRVNEQNWLLIVDDLAHQYYTASNLAHYSKEQFDKPDNDYNKTLFQHLIFALNMKSEAFPEQTKAVEAALQGLIKADKITHNLQLAERAVPDKFTIFAALTGKVVQYYKNTIAPTPSKPMPTRFMTKYIMRATLLVIAGLLAYKYYSAPSLQDEDDETETGDDNTPQPELLEAN